MPPSSPTAIAITICIASTQCAFDAVVTNGGLELLATPPCITVQTLEANVHAARFIATFTLYSTYHQSIML
jgi:hypothetical protein